MGEKASVFQTVQIGIETTPGTSVPANKKLLTASIIPSAKVEAEEFRALGNKYPSFVSLNKEWSVSKIEGKLSYNETLYFLSSLLSQPTPVQQGGTSAYKWTFTSSTSSEDSGKTFTIEQGDANSAWRVAGTRVSGLELTFTRDDVGLSGEAIGRELETGITMTSSPTSLPPKPVLPNHVSLYTAASLAGLASANAVSRGFSLGWKLTNKVDLVWPIGQNPVPIEVVPTLEATLKLATDATGLGFITTMRDGSTHWFRVRAVGSLIESTYYQTFQIDFPAQIKDISEFADEDGLYLVEYTLQGIHDPTWGKAFQIDITTDVQTL